MRSQATLNLFRVRQGKNIAKNGRQRQKYSAISILER